MTSTPRQNGLTAWLNQRLPVAAWWRAQMSGYPVPKNLNVWYVFGSLALLLLANQVLTGIFLTMNYQPSAALAFASVQHIMREVRWGWLIRYLHVAGASLFFAVLYLHLFRGVLYGSYRAPRELVWLLGCTLFICLIAEAFCGYLLPWGQMSYWGAQVITNLFSSIPVIGPDLALWIRGDYVVSDVTLNRFFALHVIAIPLVVMALALVHLVALRQVGSNNPDGIDIKHRLNAQGVPLDSVPFHPYYTVRDLLGVCVFLMVFAAIVFFAPTMGGYFLEANNFVPANPLQTPAEISPAWYFTAFYAMLRATTGTFRIALMVVAAACGLLALARARGKWRMSLPAAALLVVLMMMLTQAKFLGVVVMASALFVLFFLPWLDRAPVRSIRYRPLFHRLLLAVFVVAFLTLAFLGTRPTSPVRILIAQICTFIYFAFFLGMPFWSTRGTFVQPPERIPGRAGRRHG
jgi:ubiquinol-cytochrome c reductase cytochrome b subunit